MAFEHTFRVRWAECDPQGIVFNANYLMYYDVGLTELWREAIGNWKRLQEAGYDVVMAEANLRFRSPAHDDEVITTRLAVAHLGRSSIGNHVEIVRDGTLLVEGETRHVVVSAETWKPTEMPAFLRDGLSPYLAG